MTQRTWFVMLQVVLHASPEV